MVHRKSIVSVEAVWRQVDTTEHQYVGELEGSASFVGFPLFLSSYLILHFPLSFHPLTFPAAFYTATFIKSALFSSHLLFSISDLPFIICTLLFIFKSPCYLPFSERRERMVR